MTLSPTPWRMCLTLALGLCATVASAADAEYELNIPIMSPLLTYLPSASGPADSAWNQTYPDAVWAYWTNESIPDPDGAPTHRTTFSGASVELSFLGSAIIFQGSAKGTGTLTVDGKDQDVDMDTSLGVNGTGTITGTGALEYGQHTARLTLKSGEVALNNVVLTTVVGGDGTRTTNQTYLPLNEDSDTGQVNSTMDVSDGVWSSGYSLSGTSADNPNGSYGMNAPMIFTSTPGSRLHFTAVQNTSILLLFGPLGVGYGAYSVTLDPPQSGAQANTSFTPAVDWLGPNKILYYASLDPTQEYRVTVDYLGTSEQQWALSQVRHITVRSDSWTPGANSLSPKNSSSVGDNDTATPGDHGDSKSDSKSSTPLGAIIGGAVGGAIGLGLIAAAIFFFCRRRKPTYSDKDEVLPEAVHTDRQRPGLFSRARRNQQALSSFEIDPSGPHNASSHSLSPIVDNPEHITPLPLPWPADLPPQPQDHGRGSALTSPVSSQGQSFATFGVGKGAMRPPTGSQSGSSGPTSTWAPTPTTNSGPSNPVTSPFADPHPLPPVGTSTSTSSPKRRAQEQTPQSPASQPSVGEAVDAGRLPFDEMVPPRYNPDWAEDYPPQR